MPRSCGTLHPYQVFSQMKVNNLSLPLKVVRKNVNPKLSAGASWRVIEVIIDRTEY